MCLLTPLERLLLNLEEDVSPKYIVIYVDKEEALRQLKELTGRDFGYDAQAWRRCLEERGLLRKK